MRINLERIDLYGLEQLGIDNWEYIELDEDKVDLYFENEILCYIKLGEATIVTEFESILIRPGDLLTFPANLDTVWDIDKMIKIYQIEKSELDI